MPRTILILLLLPLLLCHCHRTADGLVDGCLRCSRCSGANTGTRTSYNRTPKRSSTLTFSFISFILSSYGHRIVFAFAKIISEFLLSLSLSGPFAVVIPFIFSFFKFLPLRCRTVFGSESFDAFVFTYEY